MAKPSPLESRTALLLEAALVAAWGALTILHAEPAPSMRVVVDATASGIVQAGTPELIWNQHAKAARVPISNLSASPVDITVRTCPILGEDSRSGGLRGLTRGFVGVLFLGASEIQAGGPVETRHLLQPGERLIVEHPLISPALPIEVVSAVALTCPAPNPESADATNESQLRLLRQSRGDYHQARKEEEARWRDLRSRLIAMQGQCQPLTAEYRACLNQYWEALNTHKTRVKLLETEFPASAEAQD